MAVAQRALWLVQKQLGHAAQSGAQFLIGRRRPIRKHVQLGHAGAAQVRDQARRHLKEIAAKLDGQRRQCRSYAIIAGART